MRAGLAGFGGMSMQILLPLFWFCGLVIFIFWIDCSYVSNIRHRSAFCKGQGIDGRALDKAHSPLIAHATRRDAILLMGSALRTTLKEPTSFPRVARGSSSRLRHHARTLDE